MHIILFAVKLRTDMLERVEQSFMSKQNAD